MINNPVFKWMIEILHNKNAATRFQILVEMASSGPDVQQKNIASRLGITPQAVSDYIRQLVRDDMVVSEGRSHYRVGPRGVNWMLKILREMRGYALTVERVVTNITICAAIAEDDISPGQTVGLKMKDGLLYASGEVNTGARGTAVSGVRRGEDIDIASIEGLVDLIRGIITILQVPLVQKGGSRKADLEKLREHVAGREPVGAIGIEALISLRRINVEPQYLYGVNEAAVEAARCGLSFTIVCSEDAVPSVIKRVQQENLGYELIDLRLND